MSKKLPTIQKCISVWMPMKPDRLYPPMPMRKTKRTIDDAIQAFMRKYPDVRVTVPDFAFSSDTVASRLDIVNHFRGTHLLMIDSDQALASDVIWKMYEACEDGRGVVLAPSIKPSPPYEPTFGFLCKNGKYRNAVIDYDYDIEDTQNNRIIEVDGGGFPAVMIRREVFDDMPPEVFGPYFNRIHHAVEKQSLYGHDLSFCMRAKAAGFKVFVHLGCRVDHFTEDGFRWLDAHAMLIDHNPMMQDFYRPNIVENNLVSRAQERMELIEEKKEEANLKVMAKKQEEAVSETV